MTTLMIALPSQFDEALRIPRSMGPTCLQEGTGSRPRGIRYRIPQKGITELIKHHKVAAAPSQPWRGGPIEAVGGWNGKIGIWNWPPRSASACLT
jgi:hypothetical protein